MSDSHASTEAFAPRRAFRFGRIRLAFVSSAASKALGLVVQLIAVPLAVKALGAERFGIYTMLVSALVWIDLGRFGIGPGLTRGLALAWNRDDRSAEQAIFSSAFWLMSAVCATIVLVIGVAFANGWAPLAGLIGSASVTYHSEILSGVTVVMTFFIAQIMFSLGESARSAYQEDYINSATYGLGNLVAIALVLGVATRWPTIQGFAVAIFGSIALSKGLNLAMLLCGSRRYLRPRWRAVSKTSLRPLLHASLAFWAVQLSTLMTQNFSLVQLGALTTPAELATFAVLFRGLQLLSTAVLMVTLPLWPAITDAAVRGDFEWIRRSYRRLLHIIVAYAAAIGFATAIGGSFFVHLWIGDSIVVSAGLCRVLGLYFFIWMWNHSHTAVLFGLGSLWPTAATLLCEGALVLIGAQWLVPRFGNLGLAWSLCVAGLATSAWILPLLVQRRCTDPRSDNAALRTSRA